MMRKGLLVVRTVALRCHPLVSSSSPSPSPSAAGGNSICNSCRRDLSSSSARNSRERREEGNEQEEERPRRSLFSVPGADERKILKAQTLGADAVVLDLEDGVAYDRKDYARELVRDTLLMMDEKASSFGNSELCVRINGMDTKELALRDLEAVLPCQRLQSIVIPKVETASDIHFVSRMIDALCDSDRDVRIIAAIESAMGILNLREIAETATAAGSGSGTSHRHPRRLDALVFASEDYCADVEAIRTPGAATELLFARSQLVTTAKAYSLQAIDMVHINFRNLKELEVECEHGRQLGFTGKQAIHPNQVDIIHQQFSPSPKDIAFATKVVNEFEGTGKGVCVVDGIVVDLPVYKWAIKICKRAEKTVGESRVGNRI